MPHSALTSFLKPWRGMNDRAITSSKEFQKKFSNKMEPYEGKQTNKQKPANEFEQKSANLRKIRNCLQVMKTEGSKIHQDHIYCELVSQFSALEPLLQKDRSLNREEEVAALKARLTSKLKLLIPWQIFPYLTTSFTASIWNSSIWIHLHIVSQNYYPTHANTTVTYFNISFISWTGPKRQ